MASFDEIVSKMTAAIKGVREAVLGKDVREFIASGYESVLDAYKQLNTAVDSAASSATDAKSSQTAAASSANAAKSSETNAAGSATAAKNALDEIEPKKDAAIAAIGTAKSEAVSAIGTAKSEALDNISSKVEQVRSDTAKAEQAASDAQSAADKAQAIATANNIDDVMMLMLVTGRVSFGLYTSSGDVLCTSDGDKLIATGQICKC
nr:MAG TPA: hypothetical protein [Caudoviricetes sp.]